jgi:hypothetical protein
MPAEIIKHTDNEITVQFTLKLTGSMLNDEQTLQGVLNEAGMAAMVPIIKQFDTNGEPIRVGGIKHTVKDYAPQTYETPYGAVEVERYTYQTSKGGRAYVPLEVDGRMILNSTPRYSRIVSGKYACLGADALREDMLESNGRSISRNYAKKLSDLVGSIAQARESEWHYDLPMFDKPVAAVSIGLDGTCMLLRDDGWREAMCGSITFYDGAGDRLYTVYCGCAPEYGKEKFREKFSSEIEHVKDKFPDVLYIGLADGAPDNWVFLKQHTHRQVLDFYHAREYIGKAASAIFGRDKENKNNWEENWSHNLKHQADAADCLLAELKEKLASLNGKCLLERREEVRQVITYYTNHKDKMLYSGQIKEHLPIGSGVTEAACKVLIKQRMCQSGSRWKDKGASSVLTLRALKITKGRWQQFWNYFTRHGYTAF